MLNRTRAHSAIVIVVVFFSEARMSFMCGKERKASLSYSSDENFSKKEKPL